MKKILIMHSNMEIGGAETSLLGLLKSIDYSRYSVDLMLLEKSGELINMIPKEVNLLDSNRRYTALVKPIKDVVKKYSLAIAISRIMAKIVTGLKSKIYKDVDLCYMIKEYSHKFSMPFLPKIYGKYDLAISFIDPHFIIQEKVNSKVKIGWLHTDFSRININGKIDYDMWNSCDYIACVSEACKEAFDKKYPCLEEKSIVIENILPVEFVKSQSNKEDVSSEIYKSKNEVTICSVGRFSEAKNFDNIPNIAKRIIESGYNIKWYLIGYGADEKLIRNKIKEECMENIVIVLGKKINPYPYIKMCDLYIQPSRYEGKAVTVREAQMLNKPVIITNFSTAKSQLEDKVDGLIVPIDNQQCAEGIISLIDDYQLQRKLSDNTRNRDYSNKLEVEKIYKLIK